MLQCHNSNKILASTHNISFGDHLNIMAFNPPSKALYTLTKTNETQLKNKCQFKEVRFIHDEYSQNYLKSIYPWITENTFILFKRNQDVNFIPIIHIINSNSNGLTILYSHGNTGTLGSEYSMLYDISSKMKANVISYDYSGYGCSNGQSSEEEAYDDIEQVGYFVINVWNIKPTEQVLLGFSLGTAPTVHWAVSDLYNDVAAVVLIAPIAFGISLVPNSALNIWSKKYLTKKVFSNLEKVSHITCPVFWIHGRKDNAIPFEHSKEWSKQIKYLYKWYPKHGDHLNILDRCRNKFYLKFKFFTNYLLQYYQLPSWWALKRDVLKSGDPGKRVIVNLVYILQ